MGGFRGYAKGLRRMAMSIKEALEILHPNTRELAVRRIQYYAGFNCENAIEEAFTDAYLTVFDALEEKHPELQDIPSRIAADINVATKTPNVPDKNVGEINKNCEKWEREVK